MLTVGGGKARGPARVWLNREQRQPYEHQETAIAHGRKSRHSSPGEGRVALRRAAHTATEGSRLGETELPPRERPPGVIGSHQEGSWAGRAPRKMPAGAR